MPSSRMMKRRGVFPVDECGVSSDTKVFMSVPAVGCGYVKVAGSGGVGDSCGDVELWDEK